ncbi:M50 family metallopeptidase [Pseudonocardia asaccharolytica]|uniref:Membrane protein n=1 Tax=Pseudonocardia asaccharolytica DSM 44247 = NBRC 16224 TaxID=1123024 RepID=A0A511D1U0_9PSEU|nr:M50 family metallopeptidase [Pseudonocardia asaccharolytica]GEL18493.1 membrane protein [Pseudonocardia asaccharolytica DSM 44247 = NBRC 16224]
MLEDLPLALQTAADRPAVLGAGVFALVVVLWTASWRLTRTVVTIAHEGGHAISAVLTGRGLTGIRLHADTSGVTHSTGAGHGIGLVLTFLGGYPAPSLLGLAGALLVAADRAGVLLWIATGLLVATLIHIRNAFGVLAVVGTGGVVGAVAYAAPPDVRIAFAAALCWFLLFGGLRAVRELQRGRRRGRYRDSDADQLARLTGVPAGMWAALFWLLSTAALIIAVWVLLVRI